MNEPSVQKQPSVAIMKMRIKVYKLTESLHSNSTTRVHEGSGSTLRQPRIGIIHCNTGFKIFKQNVRAHLLSLQVAYDRT